MIEVNSITKDYGKVRAVYAVSFSVDKGDIVGFIGRNGAGKSTTMGMMTGCISPDSGTITVDGFDILKNPMDAKRLMGFLPEEPPLYKEFTVNEYLSVMYDMKHIRGNKKEIINEAVKKSGLEEVCSRRCANLSKGYRQRVGLAQAILGDPRYIILDEPTSGMDPEQKNEMLKLIKQLSVNTGIILSSHILSEVDKICNRIIMLEDGKLIKDEKGFNGSHAHIGEIRYTYKINGEDNAVKAALEHVPGITGISITHSEKRLTQCVVSMNNKRVVTAIFYALAKAELPIMGMNEYAANAEMYFKNKY